MWRRVIGNTLTFVAGSIYGSSPHGEWPSVGVLIAVVVLVIAGNLLAFPEPCFKR